MTTPTTTPTAASFRQWAQTNAALGVAVVAARAFAAAERARVDAYVRPMLADWVFVADQHDGGTITDGADLYLTTDARVDAFYAACDEAHRAHGFTGPAGYCPALVAEDAARRAQHALIVAAEPVFGVGPDDLGDPDKRRQWVDLLVGACVTAQRESATAVTR